MAICDVCYHQEDGQGLENGQHLPNCAGSKEDSFQGILHLQKHSIC